MIGSEAPLKCSQRYSRLIIIRFLYKLIIAGLGGPTAYSPAEGEIPNTCSCSCEAECVHCNNVQSFVINFVNKGDKSDEANL